MKKIATLLLFLGFMPTSAFAATSSESIKAIYESIHVINSLDLSCQNDSDCRALPVGNWACGGPSGYIVASIHNENFPLLQSLAKVSQQMAREYNRENSIISTCVLIAAPEIKCVNVCARKL